MKVKYGFSNVHYALYTPGAAGAVGTWSKPKRIPGAVSFSPEPQENTYDFFADNGNYFSYTKDNGDAGDLEMAIFPAEFLKDILGWETDASGALMELTNKPQQAFALLIEAQGVNDENELERYRAVYYNATGGKPSQDYSTSEEDIEVQTSTMAITARPIDFGGGLSMAKLSVTETSAPAAFENFFDSVYTPMPLAG